MWSQSELQSFYDQMWEQAHAQFQSGHFNLDDTLDDPHDDRRGVSLIARPDAKLNQSIDDFMALAQALEPAQFYAPPLDRHITCMSIISCYSGFQLASIHPSDYQDLIQQALWEVPSFEVEVRGITASPSSILLQGFPQNHYLEQIRNNLRKYFKSSHLEQSIDQRYKIKTAHISLIRFRKPLKDSAAFINFLAQERHRYFGKFRINQLEFVYNDWFQRSEVVEKLATFDLQANLNI